MYIVFHTLLNRLNQTFSTEPNTFLRISVSQLLDSNQISNVYKIIQQTEEATCNKNVKFIQRNPTLFSYELLRNNRKQMGFEYRQRNDQKSLNLQSVRVDSS